MRRSRPGFLPCVLARGGRDGNILDDKWRTWQWTMQSSLTWFQQPNDPPEKAKFEVNTVLLLVRGGWDNELLSSRLPYFIYSISGLRRLQATNKRPADLSLSFSRSLFLRHLWHRCSNKRSSLISPLPQYITLPLTGGPACMCEEKQHTHTHLFCVPHCSVTHTCRRTKWNQADNQHLCFHCGASGRAELWCVNR